MKSLLERFTYDAAGRLDTFKNRRGNVQTSPLRCAQPLTYAWDDNLTPRVDFELRRRVAPTEIDNANATISRAIGTITCSGPRPNRSPGEP
jgi:hypothetical protein